MIWVQCTIAALPEDKLLEEAGFGLPIARGNHRIEVGNRDVGEIWVGSLAEGIGLIALLVGNAEAANPS